MIKARGEGQPHITLVRRELSGGNAGYTGMKNKAMLYTGKAHDEDVSAPEASLGNVGGWVLDYSPQTPLAVGIVGIVI